MDTVNWSKEEIKNYLDECIIAWREIRDNDAKRPENLSERDCICYVDAYQSVRTSLFGSTLP